MAVHTVAFGIDLHEETRGPTYEKKKTGTQKGQRETRKLRCD
jgi:hypothetical protein